VDGIVEQDTGRSDGELEFDEPHYRVACNLPRVAGGPPRSGELRLSLVGFDGLPDRHSPAGGHDGAFGGYIRPGSEELLFFQNRSTRKE
jgi:hypothetical protein